MYDFSDITFFLADNYRQRLVNAIHVANVENDKFSIGNNKYAYLKKVGELDFIQEINGFFHARNKCYIHDNMEDFIENIPDDVNVTYVSNYPYIAAGDYVVDKDFNIYRITGWDNNNNSEHYFDFVDGSGSNPIKLKTYNNGIKKYYYSNM